MGRKYLVNAGVTLGHVDDQPMIRIIRGAPTAEELAALVGVLLSRRVPAPVAAAPSRWARSARPGVAGRPGPGAWRASALPTAAAAPLP